MIVSAADYHFREVAILFLSSLVKSGGIDLDNFIFFIFDISREKDIYQSNCSNMLKCILNINASINYEIINFDTMQEIVKKTEKCGSFNIVDVVDHLKVFVYTYIRAPYLWVDSDIIVRREINSLYNDCRHKGILSMGRDKDPFIQYYQYYKQYTNLDLHGYFKHLGTFNSGVMYIPKSYTRLWRDIFSKIGDSSKSYLGQGAWNIIFWLEDQVCILDKEYNTFYRCDSYFQRKKARLLHFSLGAKREMVSIYGKRLCPGFSSS